MNDEIAEIEPVAILVCDQIREEANTSETFYGVLNSGAWLFYEEPRVQPLAISFVYEVKKPGRLQFELEISGNPLQQPIHLGSAGENINVAPNEHEYSSATAGDLKLDLVRDGVIHFKWRRSSDDEWELLRNIRIKPKEKPKGVKVGGLTASASTIHSATTTGSIGGSTVYEPPS